MATGPVAGRDYEIAESVAHAALARPYERQGSDPVHRPLQVYALDPAASRWDGAVAELQVPYERLCRGPQGQIRGSMLEVDDHDRGLRRRYNHVDLDSATVLIGNGLTPSPSAWQFHQQMVYAVAAKTYADFRAALGRGLGWGFWRESDPGRLRLLPHAGEMSNAYYDPRQGEIRFGYFKAVAEVAGRNLPGGYVFTCLSHDIIVHETTHALLDGLRAHFREPTNPDVLAFHEAFADLMALFAHFRYPQVVATALEQTRCQLDRASVVAELARQLGQTTGAAGPLRTAMEELAAGAPLRRYGQDTEPHALGSVLVAAVFEAFVTVFQRKAERYIRLATGGSGILSGGRLPHDLRELLAERATRLARQIMAICIRAIDYCPPIDITFGEYLRALVTADRELVPDDPYGYREACVDAFRRRGIYPRDVPSLAEDALLWRPPRRPVALIEGLSFAEQRFAGDPSCPADATELRRQAACLGEVVSRPENLAIFGLAASGDPRLEGDAVAPPSIKSVRSLRRVGPDGQVLFDLVAEVTQRRTVRARGPAFDFYGGATLIIDPLGEVRYVISKSVANGERLDRQRAFIAGSGSQYWALQAGVLSARAEIFKLLHEETFS